MQEKAKTNKIENIVEWIITIIFTIALFVSAFLFSIDMANADSIPADELQEFDNSFYQYINETFGFDNIKTQIDANNIVADTTWNYTEITNNARNHTPNMILGWFTNEPEIDISNFNFDDWTTPYSLTWYTPCQRGSSYDHLVTSWSSKNIDWQNVKLYFFIKYWDAQATNNYCCYLYKVNLTNRSDISYQEGKHAYSYNVNYNLLYREKHNNFGYNDYIDEYINVQYMNGYTYKYYNYNQCFGYYVSSSHSYWFGINTFKTSGEHLILKHTPTVSTSGFNVFIYNDLGIDYVRFVPNGLVTVGSHYSNNPTISFNLVLNNDVTIPVTYDESAGYYFESIEYGKAYYEIPVVELLPSSISDFDNIYITNVVYTNNWSNPSDSGTDTFYYVDKCWLKRTYNNENIGQVSIPYESTDTGYSQQEITDIYNMITNASTLAGTFDVEKNLSGGSSSPISFSSFKDAVVNTIECYHVTGTTTSDWSHIEIDYPPISVDSGNNMYWLNYNGNTTGSFNNRYSYYCSPYSYVRENNYSGYYDIVYFIVHEMVYDESGNIAQYSNLSTTYTKYYYFISYRYYNKLILYREMDILEYLKLGNEGQEKIYDYLFYKINNIDDNIYYFFKDKLNIDNDIVDKIREIDNSITLSTDSIMDLLNRILDALLDINIEPVEPLDITPITTRLDLILEKQTSSNLNNDWYKNFRQWLYEETDNNLLDTPHEWFIDKLPSIKSLYNIFGGHDTSFYYTPMINVIDGYIHGQDLLNDETTYSTFYYKGTWSSGFNTSTFDSYHIGNINEVQ